MAGTAKKKRKVRRSISRTGRSPAKPRLRGACPVNSVTHRWRENGRGRNREIRAALLPVMTNQSATGFASNGVSCRIQQAVTFYPASGYRSVGSGVVTDVGNNGYCWLASPSGAPGGVIVSFSSVFVSPQSSTFRGSGFPLRCIQEFALRGADSCFGQDEGARKYDSRSFGQPQFRLGGDDLWGHQRLLLVGLAVQRYLGVVSVLRCELRGPAALRQPRQRVPPALHPRICVARCWTAVLVRMEMQGNATAGASGNRSVDSGAMGNEGSVGYYWSASPYSATYGLYLNFYSVDVVPQSSSFRGNGYPLRCIQGFALRGALPDKVARRCDGRSFGQPQRQLGRGGRRGQQRLLLVGLAVQCYSRVASELQSRRCDPAAPQRSRQRVPPALHPRICAARYGIVRRCKRV